MAQNVEIKAFIDDFEDFEEKVVKISDCALEIIHQHDIFFNCESGRLKLRIFDSNSGVLIGYTRADSDSPSLSSYLLSHTDDPHGIKELLTKSLGTVGEVKKERHLYFSGNTRIHIDKVEDLGTFVELEVVLGAEDTVGEGRKVARELMKELCISKDSLIDVAYIDMM